MLFRFTIIKHPFIPSSLIPSRAFYMRAAFSVMAGMFKVEPTIEWLPRLSPQLVGSASSDHYLNGWVARPLNGLPHEPFPDWHRTVRARHIDHRVDANARSMMAGFGRPTWLGKSPTCRRHVGPTAKSWHFWPTRPSRADTNSFRHFFVSGFAYFLQIFSKYQRYIRSNHRTNWYV